MSQDGMHKVRVHLWRDGVLTYLDSYFISEDDAMIFAQRHGAKEDTAGVKIFDVDDQLTHSVQNTPYDPGIYA